MARIEESRIEELLNGPHQGVLSVSRSEKGPVAVPMSYLFQDGRFFMATSTESLHGRLMKRTGAQRSLCSLKRAMAAACISGT